MLKRLKKSQVVMLKNAKNTIKIKLNEEISKKLVAKQFVAKDATIILLNNSLHEYCTSVADAIIDLIEVIDRRASNNELYDAAFIFRHKLELYRYELLDALDAEYINRYNEQTKQYRLKNIEEVELSEADYLVELLETIYRHFEFMRKTRMYDLAIVDFIDESALKRICSFDALDALFDY